MEIVDWDTSQRSVIAAAAPARLIVDAGPGTGKTAVACGRVAALIKQHGVAPAGILIISFTRTAVAEIRARLYDYVGEDAFAVKIVTIDAYAWSLHSGFDSMATLSGTYDDNIERVLSLVKDDEDVAEELESLEHVVLDEAQDFVGARAELVAEILGKLDPACGITIFADDAQAIYGFAEDAKSKSGGDGSALKSRIRSLRPEFIPAGLESIHRTDSNTLKAIFRDVRSAVLNADDDESVSFSDIQSRIEELADANGHHATNLGLEALDSGSFVLFRTRAEALMTSQFCDAPHSLRLSGYSGTLPAWIGACFFDYQESFLDESTFLELWLDRIEEQCSSAYGVDRAWELLRNIAGGSGGVVDMGKLRRQLSRARPPVEIATSEYGLAGPIIGTVHASKGREADNVILLLGSEREFDTRKEEVDEIRILFVGATRARRRLEVGKAIKYTGNKLEASGRAFRKVRNGGAMVEIGRSGDLYPEGLVGSSYFSSAECLLAHKHFARLSGVRKEFFLELVQFDENWNYGLFNHGFHDRDQDRLIGVLSKGFRRDLWEAGKRIGRKGAPSKKIKRVRSLGSRTVVLADDDATLSALHAPWSRTGFMLAPNLTAFTNVYFNG